MALEDGPVSGVRVGQECQEGPGPAGRTVGVSPQVVGDEGVEGYADGDVTADEPVDDRAVARVPLGFLLEAPLGDLAVEVVDPAVADVGDGVEPLAGHRGAEGQLGDAAQGGEGLWEGAVDVAGVDVADDLVPQDAPNSLPIRGTCR
ncbi:hypothetical protein ACGFY9_28175 [Streptomyces sp. NPDC048504]|uniref:hypothetical protein n=1 Tax=Streptomyces sp. NPDC048504 TaxID=3365559 RepID=UPI0037145536